MKQNMGKNNTIVGRQALFGMLNGIKTVAEAVRPTYGGKGVNAVIERDMPPFYELTNDAQAIIQSIQISDKLENIGLKFIKELSDKANKESGNGRKTTFLIASEILEKGIEANVDGNTLKQELYDLIPLIEKEIDIQKEVITVENVENVATTASQDKEIGSLIQEIYLKIGKEGVIHIEGSGTYNTSYDFIDGVRFANGTGLISESLVHDEQAIKEGKKEMRAIYEKPTILVTKRKISNVNDIDPLLKTLERNGKKDLIIFADDMDSNVASMLISLHKSKVMNICIVKPSVLWKNFVFEDFAKCVGATIVEDANGINFKTPNLLTHLGTCDKIIIDTEETVLLGISDITEHLAQLKAKGDNDSLLRILWLSSKTAILKLGAGNEGELSQKRAKTQDAVNSTRLALSDGIVTGGGIALSNIADKLPDTLAGKIVAQALRVPLQTNLKNMALIEPNWGPEVIDASVVVKNAVKIAIKLAGIVLTTGVVINFPEQTMEEKQLQILSAKRSPF